MSKAWMPLYVADYRADTAHLSAAQHGAYLLLIMHYWTTGSLPPADDALARIACMTPTEWRKTRPTIAAFFSPEWKHKRIDAELSKALEISNKRRASVNQRYNKSSTNVGDLNTQSQSPSPREDYPPDGGPPSNSPSSVGYAFDVGVIRLRKREFDQWTIAFCHLELRAELIALEPWAAQQSNWFVAVSQALAKKNREAKLAIEKAKSQGDFRWNGIEGVI